LNDNNIHIEGNGNITIQDITGASITINATDFDSLQKFLKSATEEIKTELWELLKLQTNPIFNIAKELVKIDVNTEKLRDININLPNQSLKEQSDYDKFVVEVEKHRFNQISSTSEPIIGKTVDDLDNKQVKKLFNQEKVKKHFKTHKIKQNENISNKLKSLNLLTNCFVIKGTFLCFSKIDKIRSVCKTADTSKFFVFEDIEGMRTKINEFISGSLIEQYFQMIEHIKNNLYLVRDIETRTEDYEIPKDVLIELIANAFIHRDYSDNIETDIKVEIYPNRIEITNPGKFPENIDLNRIEENDKSFIRNPEIVKAFFLHSIVETAAKGIKRVQNILKQQNFPTAKFEQKFGYVKVTVYKKDYDSKYNKYLTPIPIRPSYFVGREDILTEIAEKLDTNYRNPIILLSGIGGIGKTTIVMEFVNNELYTHKFNHIIWISIQNNLLSDFITTLITIIPKAEKQQIETEYSQIRLIINFLKNFKGENLIIIDNVNSKDDLEKCQSIFAETGWKFLITTRTQPERFKHSIIYLEELAENQAIELFNYHYNFLVKDNNELSELLKHISNHTLLIELLAKIGIKKGFSISSLLKLIKEQDFLLNSLHSEELDRKIDTGNHAKTTGRLDSDTVFHYILSIFEPEKLNENSQTILRFFSVLPAIDIPLNHLKTLWQVDKDKENEFEDQLEYLHNLGWLFQKQLYNSNSLSITYRMHPLIQEVVYVKLPPDIVNVRPLIKAITQILSKPVNQPIEFTEYAKSIIHKFTFIQGLNENADNIR